MKSWVRTERLDDENEIETEIVDSDPTSPTVKLDRSIWERVVHEAGYEERS